MHWCRCYCRFPGETDKDFQDTLRIVEEVKYAHAYSFKYSSRPGTPASIMENHIEEDVKSERLKILQDLIKPTHLRPT